ncbi:hypothetical protein DFP72DRAFT_120643 [Ephemerocybe angulata]|uniref:Uncharacterized protein n=1 Tax=Ephemerocybe angulata TaxID=980116 RepID=A0A8H6I9T9_9AGAR|nr:hypothetical protein DFP72DRAFT_120643 [Tulosesus angulatus]
MTSRRCQLLHPPSSSLFVNICPLFCYSWTFMYLSSAFSLIRISFSIITYSLTYTLSFPFKDLYPCITTTFPFTFLFL